ncbi:hypothetical protein PF008_g24352 [Phytophthora fragariae]|uniref:Uncharacterized protein n=1 Tax=Phytophthora fragariae TaxID=53985 RepID=A0A6G0QN59_9STRA|nr:hypothetical protein PF008_g24352 [Phytophthora fragariae]
MRADPHHPHQSIAASPISTARPSAPPVVVETVRAPESSEGVGSLDWDRDESDVVLGFLLTGFTMSPPLPKLPLPLSVVTGAGLPAQAGPAGGAETGAAAGVPGATGFAAPGAAVGGALVVLGGAVAVGGEVAGGGCGV